MSADVDEPITELPVTDIGLGTRVLTKGNDTQMYTGILTQVFPRMDNYMAISNLRCMRPVNRSPPTLIMGTIPGPPTTPSKDRGTIPPLETASVNVVNAVNAASIAIVTGNVDAATDTLNPIPMLYRLPNPIPNPPSSPRSLPGLKTSL